MKNALSIIIATLLVISPAFAATLTSTDSPTFVITLVNYDPVPARPGGFVDVDIQATNIGSSGVNNVIFEIPDSFPFSIETNENARRNFNSVRAGQTLLMDYKVAIDPSAFAGSNDLEIRYSLDGGESWVTKVLNMQIETDEAELAVTQVNAIPDSLIPGQKGVVEITIKNFASSLVQNIEATLDLEDTPLSPVTDSNKKYVRSLASGASSTLRFEVAVDADATSQVYRVPLDLSFSDTSGTEFSDTLTIGVQVYEAPAYLLNLEEQSVYTQNAKGDLILSFSNVGTSEIKFLTMELLSTEEYDAISPASTYLGNLESDDFQTATFKVFTRKATDEEITLKVKLNFKDTFNTQVEQVVDLPMNIYSPVRAQQFGLIPTPSIPSIIFGMAFGGLFALFWFFMLFNLIRNKELKKEKRVLWFVAFFVANIAGAIAYYFLARHKEN